MLHRIATASLGPVVVEEGEPTSIGRVPVGSTCTVHQPEILGIRALAGAELSTVVDRFGGEVRFVNGAADVPSSFTVALVSDDPTLAGAPVQLRIQCDGTDETVIVAIGSSRTTEDLLQGDTCTVSVIDSGSAAPTESSRYDAVLAAGENEVVVPFAVDESTTWPFNGFFEPVENLPVINRMQAGRAVPLRFSLGGDRGLDILVDGVARSRQIACDSGAPTGIVEEAVAAGESGLQYDPASDRYTYVWKTAKSWAGRCRELIVALTDGSTHRALFELW